MPPVIRALIVADAVATRRFVAQELGIASGIEVVGTAPNARIALTKIASLRPDVITLSPELPEDGALQLVRGIRESNPRLPVLIFSVFSVPRPGDMRNLLAAGATACVSAPVVVDQNSARCTIRDYLVPRIKALCTRPPERLQRVDLVAIGISTGGPNALPAVLGAMPSDFPVPILIVQHMPPVFTRQLAERLDTKCALQVREAASGAALEPGHVWLAPGDQHMVVATEGGTVRLLLQQGPPENSCRPSVDPLFRSVAAVFAGHSLAVVMTGMGRDGLKGCDAIRNVGGQIVVQDEASSVVWGMPGSVARGGLADAVLPLDAIGPEILRRVQFGRASRSTLPSHAG